jgi:hypothetical protein
MDEKITVTKMLKIARDKNWVLPNFQREYVWTPKQIADLFDSIIRGYPIGAIILLKYRRKSHFQARGLDGTEGAGQRHQFYIIDGQQRLTTLYKIIQEHANRDVFGDGEKEAHYLSLRESNKDQGKPQNFAFFLNLKNNNSDTGIKWVIAERQRKSKKHSNEELRLKGYVPLEYVFCDGRIGRSYLLASKFTQSDLRKVTEIRRNVINYRLTIQGCDASWGPDDYRDVFSRLNNAGTRLSAFDECASIRNNSEFNLHKLWKTASGGQKYSTIQKFDIDPMYILKTMFVLNQIKCDEVIQSPSLRNIKKLFRETQNYKELRQLWDEALNCMQRACHHMDSFFGVKNKALLPYTPMTVTLAGIIFFFRRYTHHARYTTIFHKKLSWWYWNSIFSSHYDKGTDNKIASDLNKLVDWCKPIKPINVKWGGTKADIKGLKVEIGKLCNSTDARYRAIQCLPLRTQKADILGNSLDEIEDHHLFPKKRLSGDDLDIDPNHINNIANRIPVGKSSNRTITKYYPFQYKQQEIKLARRVRVPYMLPEDIFELNEITFNKRKYLKFLKQRAQLIIEELSKLLENKP